MSDQIADGLSPPYYAVIFTSLRTEGDEAAYQKTAQEMLDLAAQQPGYLGVESAHSPGGLGMTISYWESLDAIANWKRVAEHRRAQALGKSQWYEQYRLRVCRVEREEGFARTSSES